MGFNFQIQSVLCIIEKSLLFSPWSSLAYLDQLNLEMQMNVKIQFKSANV